MARVTLVEENEHPELAELIGKIKGRRGGQLLNLYKLLLNSPALAEAWLDFVNAVRWSTDLDGKIRELVILRVATLNHVEYVIRQHATTYAIQDGLTPEQVAAVADWSDSPLFDGAQRAALAYADAMTTQVDVPDGTFAELRQHYSEKQAVELSVLIGTYNMHTRVLQALKIDPESGTR
jgi:alkylhydroperoxidase family enzyme